jgi:hypothetical protein
MKIGICCIVKQENLYLRDWVKYYYDMGIKNIILYDNNNVDGEYPQQVIGDYIANGFVIYKDVRGRHRCQIECYNQCFQEYGAEFNWMGFFDIDEYWFLSPHLKFEDFFSEERFPNAYAIFINWLCYGDNDLVHYDGRPVYERFTKPTFPLFFGEKYVNTCKKCFVRYIPDTHIEFVDCNAIQYRYKNEDGYKYKAYTVDGMPMEAEYKITYQDSHIKHYRTLTIEEFLYRRFGRGGYADLESPHNVNYIMNMFWEQNEWTEEKQKIIDDFFENFNIIEDVPENCPYKF